ncbi:MAG TPA: hypothetical protein VF290_26215, partial [Pyrinomonadaceae bacterium]
GLFQKLRVPRLKRISRLEKTYLVISFSFHTLSENRGKTSSHPPENFLTVGPPAIEFARSRG